MQNNLMNSKEISFEILNSFDPSQKNKSKPTFNQNNKKAKIFLF